MSNKSGANELNVSTLESTEGNETYRPKHMHEASPTSVVDRVTGFDGASGASGLEIPFDMEGATTNVASLQPKRDNEYLNKTSSGRSLTSFGFRSSVSGVASWVNQKLINSSFHSGMSWSLNSAVSFYTLPPSDTEQQQNEPVQPIGLCVAIEQDRGELMGNSKNLLLSTTTLDSGLAGCENLDFSMSTLGIHESSRTMELEVDNDANISALTTVPHTADIDENRAKESVPYTDADVLCGQGGTGKCSAQSRDEIQITKRILTAYQLD